MSCPDWQAVCRRHDAAPDDASKRRVADEALEWRVADEALEWQSALSHLDGCPACQSAAPAFDPTLLFRRLPALEADRDDVEAMKLAVAGMRRGQTIERRGSVARPWLRAAAVAAVLLGSLMLRGGGVGPEAVAPVADATDGVTPDGVTPAASLAPAASDIDLWRMPLIETVDPTYGPIFQVDDDDFSLVLVPPSDHPQGFPTSEVDV